MRSVEQISQEVTDNEKQYKALIEQLRTFFSLYSASPEGQNRIYRIYSRSDKQNGELKEAWKIGIKMQSGQLDTIFDVPDIVGITIVCPFQSDLLHVLNVIKGPRFAKDFTIVQEYEHESFYRATHLVVHCNGVWEVKGEIQIKTMFHDAWSAKSHDLIYKPKGEIDRRFTTQMGSLSTILNALEIQSDIIKEMVEEIVYFDRKKRDFARRRIILDLDLSLQDLPDCAERTALSQLKAFCDSNKAELATNDVNSVIIREFKQKVNAIGKEFQYGRNLCRIVASVGVSRETEDFLSMIHSAVSNWKSRIHKLPEYPIACPYHFFAMILYAFGLIERAVREAEAGLEARGEVSLKGDDERHARASSLGNAAQYYAELGWVPGRGVPQIAEAREKAETYISKALALTPDDPGLIDTAGFVKIAFAEDEQTIDLGLADCRRSWELCRNSRQADVSDLFYEIHRRQGYRKILALGLPRANL